MWAQMLTENFGVTDATKKAWVAEYASVHEVYESALGLGGAASVAAPVPSNGVSPLYATPLNTTGMGNVAAPGAPVMGGSGDFFKQAMGSGDIPVSTLPMALNVALMTIGLELVPVIPAKGPWAMLTYMDFPYAGGKLGRRNEIAGLDGVGAGAENKPLYFKVIPSVSDLAGLRAALKDAEGKDFVFTTSKGIVTGTYKTMGRMDGGLICQIKSSVDADGANVSLKEAFGADLTAVTLDGTDVLAKFSDKAVSVDFAQTHVDFVDGFANFATGAKAPMSRAENETGTGNVLGLRLFSKWISMGSYEVTATVTRQQLQDLPLYGVDAVSKVMEACQNEITQSINARILEHVFALGVTNAVQMKARQGADFNLWIGTADTTLDKLTSKYVDIYGTNHAASTWAVPTAEVTTSAENTYTRQRRISSRILAAANLIQVTGRRGRANWVVTNAQVATALQDCAGYVVAPMVNTFAQDGSKDLYQAGTLAGIKVYVDPYMDWDDCRVCVGRKGNGNEPGVIFMPYILADTVSITAEGTMAPKMLVNSRYAIADAGFYPEKMYYTFAVGSEFGLL